MSKKDEILAPFPPRKHDHVACVTGALDVAEEKCRREGLRLTPLRRRTGAAPPTVYRALDFLLEHELIHRIESLNAFVGCGDPARRHGGQFLICTDCGSVAELDDPAIARTVSRSAGSLGFTVAHQTIEISGRCGACTGAGAD